MSEIVENQAIENITPDKKYALNWLGLSRILFVLAIFVAVISILLWNPLHVGIIDEQTSEQQTFKSMGFDVKMVDEAAIISAEVVEKNGVTYELLCKETGIRDVNKIEEYECEVDDMSKPIIKEITNTTTFKLQNATTAEAVVASMLSPVMSV